MTSVAPDANPHNPHPRPGLRLRRRREGSQTRRALQVAGRGRARLDESAAATAGDQGHGWTRDALPWLSVLAPTTLLTGLLFYFGYVGTRARYEYFGVDLTMVDLSTQELLLAGLEVVYVAALVICFGILIVVAVHAAVWWLLISGAREPAWWVAGLMGVAGLLLIGRAVVGIAIPGVAAAENPPGQTRLALALGPVVVAYSLWIAMRLLIARTSESAEPSTLTRWSATPMVRMLRRISAAAVLSIFVVGMFSATNSFAWAFGTGRAYDNALHLKDKPEVIVDVRQRLQALPLGVTEISLGQADGENFRYRYRGLRLLIASGGKLFLIPEPWTRAGRTIILPYDNDVRIQLIPAPTIYESK